MLFRELPISQPDEDDILGALVARATQGSSGAFTELASRVRSRVRDWAARVVHDDDDADDVAQQVLLKLHMRLREFEGRSRFTTWLYRMTLNTALNRRRVDRRRANLLLRITPQSTTVTPETDVRESDRIAALVRACLDELSHRERQVFEMADLKGVATGEIAAKLNLEPVSVRAALSRARKRIRLRMMEQHRYLLEEYDL
ncbi:MAG TPA: sigma-70 family RNA polymerase sigma factor [Gemmatimonadaceae bacterium]|nr:sigma-70 family RNA polymerase sigma factor [Gemmatimonadaceae bacterium]